MDGAGSLMFEVGEDAGPVEDAAVCSVFFDPSIPRSNSARPISAMIKDSCFSCASGSRHTMSSRQPLWSWLESP